MEVLAATAIRYDSTGRQSALKVGRIDTSTDAWLIEPTPIPAAEVIELLLSGARILTIFDTPDARVTGPELVVHGGGDKVIAQGPPVNGRMVGDLPRF